MLVRAREIQGKWNGWALRPGGGVIVKPLRMELGSPRRPDRACQSRGFPYARTDRGLRNGFPHDFRHPWAGQWRCDLDRLLECWSDSDRQERV